MIPIIIILVLVMIVNIIAIMIDIVILLALPSEAMTCYVAHEPQHQLTKTKIQPARQHCRLTVFI